MARLRVVEIPVFHGGLRSYGAGSSVQVRAFCQCGWEGPTRAWEPETKAQVQEDLGGHQAQTGHTDFPDGIPSADGLHVACGYFHNFQHSCPTPYDSPTGRVRRVLQGTINNRTAALDRLAAITELRTWLDNQEPEAVIGARMAGATWVEMGDATGTSRQGAWNRWGPMVKRYEESGLLFRTPGLPPPHPPVDPAAVQPGDGS